MNTRTKQIIAVLLALMIPAAVYGYCRYQMHTDIANSKALEAEMIASTKTSRGRSSEFRQKYEAMSDSEKKEFRKTMMQKHQSRMQRDLTNYFAMSPKDRVAHLDRKIKESAKRRKDSAKRGGDRTGERRGGPDRTSRSSDKTPEEREAARAQMKRRMLDNTTPKLRAQMSEYRRAMNERREELGLPTRERGRGGRHS